MDGDFLDKLLFLHKKWPKTPFSDPIIQMFEKIGNDFKKFSIIQNLFSKDNYRVLMSSNCEMSRHKVTFGANVVAVRV